jgi:hypothetical protein
MKKTIKRYPINQCLLYKCQSKKKLEKALVLQTGHLRLLDEVIRYHNFEIEKKGTNEKRRIETPVYTLKLIQSRILRLMQSIERPEWLISGQKGKSYIDNGEIHRRGNYCLTIDIKKFYDNCQREYVFRFFKDKMKTSPDIAAILTKIVTYHNGIPTGCPTSQLMAYYAYEDMFNEIQTIAKSFGCKFSLYVDDMTFSSVEPFNKKRLEREVDLILRKYKHKPKYKKVHYYSKNESKPITGTIIKPDHQLEVPNKLQENIYKGFQEIKIFDLTILGLESIDKIITLKGRISAAKNIQPDKFNQISSIISKIPLSLPQDIKSNKRKAPRKIRIRKKGVFPENL